MFRNRASDSSTSFTLKDLSITRRDVSRRIGSYCILHAYEILFESYIGIWTSRFASLLSFALTHTIRITPHLEL